MKRWRLALILFAGAIGGAIAFYAMGRLPLTGAGAVLLGLVATWLGRESFRSNLTPNPFGADRDYSSRPALKLGLIGMLILLAGFAWLLAMVRVVPDSIVGTTVLIGPFLVAIGFGLMYIFKAKSRFMYGGKK